MTLSTGLRVAARMGTIGTESAFEVSARARALEAEGRSIIHLQIGEPDFDTPAHVREAAKRALDEGATHYAPFPGIPALREAIAADVALRKGVTADPSQVFVTVGGKGVMLYAILGLVDPGDEVLVTGQDADLAACQRIVAGTQFMTIYKPLSRLAGQAAELARRLRDAGQPAGGRH